MSTTAVPSAAVQKQLKQGKVKKGIFSVIRHLVLALLAFIWLVPIAWLLLTSFSTDKGINFTRFVPESFTMWNYVSIMTQPDSVAQFPRWFMNTLVVACFNCVISTCFVLMVAYAISCCRFKGRKLLQNLSVTVNLFPGVLAMIAVYFVLKYMNLTNSYAGLIMVYAGSSGLGYLICKGFFDTVPVALREAAKLDGASEARIFFQIVIPMSRPILVYTIISSFLTPWTDFVVAKMILNSGVSSDWTVAIGLYMLLGGAPLALTYKAINTMDSMLGYKNQKYLYFGRAAARLDDAANYLPSRLAGLLWVAAAALTGSSARGAWKIWRRDRRNHASPNSAQTESACAGALGVQLAGPAYYFGEYYDKPTIGDALRPVEPKDILRADRMMYAESLLALVLGIALRLLVLAM